MTGEFCPCLSFMQCRLVSRQLLTSPFRHEHLYEKIEHRLIRSDGFPETPNEAARLLGGARVVLCTLSALAVDRLQSITHVVPPQMVLVDEASQIEVGDFVPLIHQYRETLQKIVFIGDDKQRGCSLSPL